MIIAERSVVAARFAWLQPGGRATSAKYDQAITYQGGSYTHIGATMNDGGHNLTLGYDALGRCVQRNLDGAITYYLYDGEKPIQEVGATLASNLYGAGIDEIVERDVSGNTYFFFQDHEGSVTHVADLAGLTERYRYDAFGAPTIKGPFGAVRSASLIGNRFLFTGREYDEDFGIYEYRARAYNPELGRFVSEDPKGFAAGDYNLFRYCKNDPEDLTDPMGLDPGTGAAQWLIQWQQKVKVLGSWIPQTQTFTVDLTVSGNYKNADPASHFTNDKLRGSVIGSSHSVSVFGITKATVDVETSSGLHHLRANLNIDWFVRGAPGRGDSRLAKSEGEHAPRYLGWWQNTVPGKLQNYLSTNSWYFGFSARADVQNFLNREKFAESWQQSREMDAPGMPHNVLGQELNKIYPLEQ